MDLNELMYRMGKLGYFYFDGGQYNNSEYILNFNNGESGVSLQISIIKTHDKEKIGFNYSTIITDAINRDNDIRHFLQNDNEFKEYMDNIKEIINNHVFNTKEYYDNINRIVREIN